MPLEIGQAEHVAHTNRFPNPNARGVSRLCFVAMKLRDIEPNSLRDFGDPLPGCSFTNTPTFQIPAGNAAVNFRRAAGDRCSGDSSDRN